MSVNETESFRIMKHLYGSIRKFIMFVVHEPPYQNYYVYCIPVFHCGSLRMDYCTTVHVSVVLAQAHPNKRKLALK